MILRSLHINLRFRTRLALVMFVTMTCTGAILTWNYVNHRREILNYVSGEASRLVTVSQLAQTQIPPKASVDEALRLYQKRYEELGFPAYPSLLQKAKWCRATTPSRQEDPREIKKFIINLRSGDLKPGRTPCVWTAEFPVIEPSPSTDQPGVTIQYPLVLGDKVIGYAFIRGESEQVTSLSRLWYKQRLYWILGTMLAALGVLLYLAFSFTKARGPTRERRAAGGRRQPVCLAAFYGRG